LETVGEVRGVVQDDDVVHEAEPRVDGCGIGELVRGEEFSGRRIINLHVPREPPGDEKVVAAGIVATPVRRSAGVPGNEHGIRTRPCVATVDRPVFKEPT